MISDIFAKESIISYFRSDIIAGPKGLGRKNFKIWTHDNFDKKRTGNNYIA